MKGSIAERPAALLRNAKEDGQLLRAKRGESGAELSALFAASRHPIAGLQSAVGNRTLRLMLAPLTPRPKVTADAPKAIHEKDADAAAEQVTLAQASSAGVANASDDGQSNPRNATRKAANPSSAQRSLLRQVPIHTLQQNLGNRTLARLFQQVPPTPVVPELSRKCACAGESTSSDECESCREKRQDSLHGQSAAAPRTADMVQRQGQTPPASTPTAAAGPNAGQALGGASGCKFTINYDVRQSECPEGYCGARIIATPTSVCGSGTGCPNLAGVPLTEDVQKVKGDFDCALGEPETGGGCTILADPGKPPTCGKFPAYCIDDIKFCMDPQDVHGQCMQHWHQRIGIGGMLAEEHDIKFALSRPNGHCSGSVSRT
jgi:hypothetical protein